MSIQRSLSAYSFLKREAERDRYEAQQVQTYQQVGKLLIVARTTSDESTSLIPFANIFVEEPLFTYGQALDPGSPAVPGSFPILSATVIKWSTVIEGPASFYNGAFIGVVTNGTPGQGLWLHYSFIGKALSYGLSGQETA